MNRTVRRFLMLASLSSPAAFGLEGEDIPALQIGPYGEGLAFVDFEALDSQLMFETTTISGVERRGSDSWSISGDGRHFGLGLGSAITHALQFSLQVRHSELDVSSTLDGRAHPGLDQNYVTRRALDENEVLAGPTLWFGTVMLGARASVLSLGEERYETPEQTVVAEAVTMPLMRLYLGLDLGPVILQGRLKLYNDAQAKAEASGSRERAKRRSPAELAMDARWSLSEDLSFGGYVTAVQAERATEGASDDYFKYGAGGLYHPVTWLALTGGAHRFEPHYKEPIAASAVAGNVGGNRLDVGAHYSTGVDVASFELGYLIPERAKELDANGQRLETERSEWNLALAWARRW